ncbi:uncharacterized protein DFL_000028 [Arthrobotrys flagrans]|uniref:EGF-like domain-containing protein n=1 Tax=Arthrobotrys flagrans TaxID=97331 RepID=A0A437ACN2_ARTFL|nr:hypothetical protein DFL_000028 [Arthrobotrys flagrans]
MKSLRSLSGILLFSLMGITRVSSAEKFKVTLSVDGRTSFVESDTAAVYYPKKDKYSPYFIGNDGSAETGGFHIWEIYAKPNTSLKELGAYKTGRSKLVEVLYDVGEKERDLVITLSMSDSLLRVFEVDEKGVGGVRGEKFVQEKRGRRGVEVVETQEFGIPIEPNACTVSPDGKVFFAGDNGKVFFFNSVDETAAPKIIELGELGGGDEVKGLNIYYGKKESYLFVGLEDGIEVFGMKKLEASKSLGRIKFEDEELEIGDFGIYQRSRRGHEDGVTVFAGEDGDGGFFGVSGLTPVFKALGKKANTKYDPRECTDEHTKPKKCGNLDDCNGYGYCPTNPRDKKATCDCFPGFTGKTCNKITCPSNCTSPSQGTCTGPNTCTCIPPFTGGKCSTLAVPARYETEESGGADGDDPAIWIHPTNTSDSRIITTVKSEVGSGLGVYDLQGKRTGGVSGGEPNNVDVLYGVDVGGKKVDLAVAGCRVDDTICMYEITSNGDLTTIPGGIQPLPPAVKELEKKFKVYGSCVYHSPKTGEYYVFINSKSSLYLQFQLSATQEGKLNTTLVRHFYVGNRGQVEGCVVDDQNSKLFLGEEPYGLWSYPAEPDEPAIGTLVDNTVVDGGSYTLMLRGLHLSTEKRKKRGTLLSPVKDTNKERGVDGVTNTDGITAVGANLGGEWEYGMVVVHDDVNQAADGTVRTDATFKIVSLKDVLGDKAGEGLGLLKGVDGGWDPRK